MNAKRQVCPVEFLKGCRKSLREIEKQLAPLPIGARLKCPVLSYDGVMLPMAVKNGVVVAADECSITYERRK